MSELEKVIDAIADRLCEMYEPPRKVTYWFTSKEDAISYAKAIWKQFLTEIVEKSVKS